jgi:hypothetical protein
MRKATLFAMALLVMAISVPAHAFDGQRKGLFAGGGLGIGWADMSGAAGGYFQPGSAYGLGAAAKVGFGLSEHLVMFSSDRQTMYREAGGHNVTQGLTGLGAMYFLRPTAPSAYVTAEFGNHIAVEGNVSWGDVSDGYGSDPGHRLTSFIVTVGWLGF